MTRCPRCYRILNSGSPCPVDLTPGPDPSQAAAPPQLAPEVPGYRLARVLGTGGFGTVWVAHRITGEGVALKVSEKADRSSQTALAREEALLRHAGVEVAPRVVDSGVLADGRAFLAMEHLQGPTLSSMLADLPGPPAMELVLQFGGALLSAAQRMHERGLLHCDLKPDNILLELPSQTAKLIDFGIAWRTEEQGRHRTPEDDTRIAGTAEYMAPEQFKGSQGLELSTDVYALGVILYELVTLRPPFVGEREAVEYAHHSLRPPRLRTMASLPRALEEVILRCLAKQPGARYANAAALKTAFLSALEGVASPASRAASAYEAHPGATTPNEVTAAPAPAAPDKRPTRSSEQIRVALLYFTARPDAMLAIAAVIKATGGHVGHSAGTSGAAIFTHQTTDQPARRAYELARRLTSDGSVLCAIVDVGSVVSRPKPDGTPRFMGQILSAPQRYPKPDDPRGVIVSRLAHELRRSAAALAF